MQLLEKLNLENSTIRNLIRNFPFLLLKSYNSYVRKLQYLKSVNMDLSEIDIFPVIFCFNLNSEIKPRIELMRTKNKYLPLKLVFAMDKTDFVNAINAKTEEYDKLVQDPAPHFERDLTFRYSKYLSI